MGDRTKWNFPYPPGAKSFMLETIPRHRQEIEGKKNHNAFFMISEMYGIIYGDKDRKILCLIFVVAVYVYMFSNISLFGMN